ncbi:MAG: response regulator [Planctomycetes bacterium]|nr:response regulator [Planctomycetota bacterium]
MTDPRVRILMVDDESPILRSLARLFAFEPWELVSATSAAEARTLLGEGGISVILSDYALAYDDGVELLRTASQLSPDTSRILFSGHIDIDLLRRAVNSGEVYRFLTKPWSDDELLQAVRQGVERWNLLQHNRVLIEHAEEHHRQLSRFNADLERLVGERTALLELRNRTLGLSQAVLDGLPVAVVGVAADGTVVLANELARRIFPEQFSGTQSPSSNTPAPWWEWSREALAHGNALVVDGSLGQFRIEVMALGERGMVMTVIPLGTMPGAPSSTPLDRDHAPHGSAT